MRFLRGIVSWINFVAYIVGLCMFLAGKFNNEDVFITMGLLLLGVGLVISLIASRFSVKGYRLKSCIFLFVNGLILFCYMMIIAIPLGKAVENILAAADPSYYKWKYGRIDAGEEKSSETAKYAAHNTTLNNQIQVLKAEEYEAMSFEQIVAACQSAAEKIKMIILQTGLVSASTEEINDLLVKDGCGYAAYLLCHAFCCDRKLSNKEYQLMVRVCPELVDNPDKFNQFLRKFYNDERCEAVLRKYIQAASGYPFENLATIIFVCGMVVDGPLNEQEKALLNFLDVDWHV